jgi:hypothetical protein
MAVELIRVRLMRRDEQVSTLRFEERVPPREVICDWAIYAHPHLDIVYRCER